MDFQAVDPIPTCGRNLQREQKQSTCCYIHNPDVSQTLSHLSGNFKHAACLDSAADLRVLHTAKLLCAHGDLSKQAFSKMLSGFSMGFAFDRDSYQLSQKNKCHKTSPLRKKKKTNQTTQPSQPNALEMLPHANQPPIQFQTE